MKIEHLTVGSNHSTIRDYQDIFPETVEFFAKYARNTGAMKLPIEKTPFHLQLTTQDGMAIFTFWRNGAPFVSNFCCFRPIDSDQVFDLVKSSVRQHTEAMKQPMPLIRKPEQPMWLFSQPFVYPKSAEDLRTLPADMSLAGEIELYMYNAIHRVLFPEKFK